MREQGTESFSDNSEMMQEDNLTLVEADELCNKLATNEKFKID